MIDINKTDVYARWLDNLRDIRARARVLARVERLAAGNPGDVKSVGEGVSECASTMAPAIECISRDAAEIVILLAGGDKGTQNADIKTDQELARNL